MIHVVKTGETITSIASQYGVSASRILYDNQIRNAAALVVGQALLILVPEVVHEVQPGETLYGIAVQYGVTVMELVRKNPFLLDNANLSVGEVLVIRYEQEVPGPGYGQERAEQDYQQGAAGPGSGQGTRVPDYETPRQLGGYLYPFAESYIIRQAMPYLSDMYLFSYGFTPEGELVVPMGQERFLAMADGFGVRSVLVLTPMTREGNFNSNLVTLLVKDTALQQVLIDNLLTEMVLRGYGALDVDFEFIEPADREGYVAFIRNLTGQMNEAGYPVSVALAPKSSDEQGGPLYGGVDYQALGEAANSVLVMAYEWGYTYGPPMAVAPLDQVRRVVEYAVARIDPAKISLGIPNYGYDWTLPYVRGTTQARTIGNVEAVELAAATGSEIQFDAVAQSPFFRYRRDGVEHVVWFEDVRSLTARFGLIAQYGLRGAGYWNLMRPFRANWLLWDATFSTVRED